MSSEAGVVAEVGKKALEKFLMEAAPEKLGGKTRKDEAHKKQADEIEEEEAIVVSETGEDAPEKLGDKTLKEEARKKQAVEIEEEEEEEEKEVIFFSEIEEEAPEKLGDKTPKEESRKKQAVKIEGEGLKTMILKSCDGFELEVDVEALKASEMIKNMINDGYADKCVFLPNVMAAELVKLVEYLDHHVGANEDKMSEVKGWNAEFVDMEKDDLVDLMMAANYLEVKPLFDLACQTIANRIKDLTVEEVREYFEIENDFTPEEEAEYREKYKWAYA